jgi:hypothetical protein
MFSKSSKNYLYSLIEKYFENKINASIFCNEYHEYYNLELNFDTLSKNEYEAFSELNKVVVRFSSSKEDLKKYPQVYYSENQLREKLIEMKAKLNLDY